MIYIYSRISSQLYSKYRQVQFPIIYWHDYVVVQIFLGFKNNLIFFLCLVFIIIF